MLSFCWAKEFRLRLITRFRSQIPHFPPLRIFSDPSQLTLSTHKVDSFLYHRFEFAHLPFWFYSLSIWRLRSTLIFRLGYPCILWYFELVLQKFCKANRRKSNRGSFGVFRLFSYLAFYLLKFELDFKV